MLINRLLYYRQLWQKEAQKYPRMQLLLLLFLLLVLMSSGLYFRQSQTQCQEAFEKIEQLEGKLHHWGMYDLQRLESAPDRLVQLQKLTTREGAPLKFTYEASSENKQMRELPLLLTGAASVDSHTVLRLLDILQPASQPNNPSDIWVKHFKLRRDKSGYVVQLSLLKRELKS